MTNHHNGARTQRVAIDRRYSVVGIAIACWMHGCGRRTSASDQPRSRSSVSSGRSSIDEHVDSGLTGSLIDVNTAGDASAADHAQQSPRLFSLLDRCAEIDSAVPNRLLNATLRPGLRSATLRWPTGVAVEGYVIATFRGARRCLRVSLEFGSNPNSVLSLSAFSCDRVASGIALYARLFGWRDGLELRFAAWGSSIFHPRGDDRGMQTSPIFVRWVRDHFVVTGGAVVEVGRDSLVDLRQWIHSREDCERQAIAAGP